MTLPCHLFPSTGGIHRSPRPEKNYLHFPKNRIHRAEATEVETEWFCFDASNTPDDHPARDAQDTLFFPPQSKWSNVQRKKDESYFTQNPHILRQIRTMLREKPPLRVIAPGDVFVAIPWMRPTPLIFIKPRDYLLIRVTVRDLKGVLDFFCVNYLGIKSKPV